MTVFSTEVEELLPAAKDVARRVPGPLSKRTLMKELRVGLPKAAAVLDALTEDRQRRRQQARTNMRRLAAAATQKRPARPLPPRSWGNPVSPMPSPVFYDHGPDFAHLSRVVETPSEWPADPISDRPLGPVRPVAVPAFAAPPVAVLETPAVAVDRPLPKPASPPRTWPVFLLALPAFVAIWSGWVDLGRLTGFGVVHPLPGILDDVALNTAITLPIGLETYAAYATYIWLSGAVPAVARTFAKWSAIGSLVLGAGGQVAYHLMVAAGIEHAPWEITTVVACIPVAVFGMGCALRHLSRSESKESN
jgi:hypothetical protein